MIDINDFLKIDIRVGTITKVKDFKDALVPSLKLWIDFGDKIGTLKSSAHITQHYSSQNLIGKQIVAVVNLPSKQIATFMSECLILGLPDQTGKVVLLQPEHTVPNGGRLY